MRFDKKDNISFAAEVRYRIVNTGKRTNNVKTTPNSKFSHIKVKEVFKIKERNPLRTILDRKKKI